MHKVVLEFLSVIALVQATADAASSQHMESLVNNEDEIVVGE